MAAVPTPPAPPWTSRCSPGRSCALREDGVVGGGEDLGQPTGLRPAESVRDRHQLALVHDGELRLAAAADDRHHAITLGEPTGPGPARGDFAGELEARDVLRRAGRSGIPAEPLMHVGAVQAGGPDPHQHLAGARLGVGVLLDVELGVADGERAHLLQPTPAGGVPRVHARSSRATHSMCGVCGNMSTGRTRRSAHPASVN